MGEMTKRFSKVDPENSLSYCQHPRFQIGNLHILLPLYGSNFIEYLLRVLIT